jgi:DnaK suppressor protein
MKNARTRLEQERDRLTDQLRRLRITPVTEDDTPRAAAGAAVDEGDQAQASERVDLEFAVRERVAERITRVTAALERVANGTYGQCQRCGEPIERPRLEAIPEVETCLACQEQIEQGQRIARV